MSPERRLHPREAQWVVQAFARGALTIALILGALIIIGGRIRWSSPSFETALTYPYAPASWGYIVGLIGLVGIVASLFGRLRIVAVTLYVLAAWTFFFAISFIQTAAKNDSAATTGIPVYLGFAVGSCLLGVTHWRSARSATNR